jgi:hypothetical protein
MGTVTQITTGRNRDPVTAPKLLFPGEVAALFLDVPGASPSFARRVFSYIDFSGDCWEWAGTRNRDGYGVIGLSGRGSPVVLAHRAVWMLLIGAIPDTKEYDHLCRNHRCVNPDHGEIVTPQVNKARGFGAAVLHAKRDTCPYGHLKDGRRGARGSKRTDRYCKTCARRNRMARYEPKGPKTECLRGHAFTAENTYIDKRGHRNCKTCKIERQREVRALPNGGRR